MSEGSFDPVDIFRFYMGLNVRVCTYKKKDGYWVVRVTKENSGEIILEILNGKQEEPLHKEAALELARKVRNNPYDFLVLDVRNKS